MLKDKEALRTSIKGLVAVRSRLKGTSYSEELRNLKVALEERLINRDIEQNNQKSIKQTGFDPELFTIGVEQGAAYIERGIISIDEFSKAMIINIGSEIKPYIKAIYNGVRDLPGLNNAGMTSYDEVNKFNWNDIELNNNPLNIQEDVKCKPVRIEQGSEGTDSGIQDNQAPIQPTRGPDRPGFGRPDSEIPAFLPNTESGLSTFDIDDVVPGNIASLFR